MSTTIAALIATLIATGMTSAVSHQFTLLGGCGAALIFSFYALVSREPIIAYMIFSWTGGPLTFPGATLLLAACMNEARVAANRQERTEPAWSLTREMRTLQGVSGHA